MFGPFDYSDDPTDDFGWLGGDFIAYAETAALPATSAAVASAANAAMAASVAPASSGNSVIADMIAHETGGMLSYAGALAVLRDAAAQPMSATLLADLKAAAKDLNVAGGVAAGGYVQTIFDDVVLGNTANAQWNGGATVASHLGVLTATSTATQFNELIGKWFLGTDLPGDASAPGAGDAGISYVTYNLPLYSTAGPKITDVNQGQLGDCWFLAAVGETAVLDPSLIEKMITVHANGTYGVEFWVNGKADYVTVNDALPTYTNGAMQWDGSRMVNASSTTSLWVPLIEKALAQLSEQNGVVTGEDYAGGQDQYYELNAGGGEGISLLTGQNTADYAIAGRSTSGLAALLGQMNADLAAGNDVLMGTSEQPVGGDLVDDHMFAVTGVNVAAGTVRLYNPWGANGVGESKPESFSISVTALAADNAYFYAALGATKAA
jgi:hypothetical protein